MVGGIYSVIKSKAPITTHEYGSRYVLIGPLNKASVSFGNTSLKLKAVGEVDLVLTFSATQSIRRPRVKSKRWTLPMAR